MSYKIKDALRLEARSLSRPQRSDLPKSELRDRMDRFKPRLARMEGSSGFSRMGASTGIPGSGTGPTMVSSPLYYDPRWSSPDKFFFPRTEEQANSIWRHLYVTDPSSAVALDLYSQSPWSDFDLVGIDDKAITHIYEDTISESRLLEKLPRFTLEFLKLGKCIVHNIFDNSRGIWIGAFHHNPDNIKVTSVPWFGYEPLMDLRPTREMEWFTSSPDRRAREITKKLPPEVVQMIRTGKPIPLDNSNVTYIGRKSADYESLGTSILTRLFRVQMLEDCLSNATIAVAQRNAAPLRIFKIGDPSTGWIPTDDDGHAEQLMELLAVAETDPFAAIVYHSGLSVEYVGVSDKMMSITREFDFIERVKMLALGISKSFLLGESSYACGAFGTLVHSNDGTCKQIQNVKSGDFLLDANGHSQRVAAAWCEGVPDKLIEIVTWGGRKLYFTANHRFPAWMWPTECACGCGEKIPKAGRTFKDKTHRRNVSLKYMERVEVEASVHDGRHRINTIPIDYDPNRVVEAQELRKGDFLKIPRTRDRYISDECVTSDMARLLGYYVAEGNLTPPQGYRSKSHNAPTTCCLTLSILHDSKLVEDIKEIGSRLGFPTRIQKLTERNAVRVFLTSDGGRLIPILEWLARHGGEGSRTKRLSRDVLLWPQELQEEFLKGYLRGDGCRSAYKNLDNGNHGTGTVQVGTTSLQLAMQLHILFAQLGFAVGKSISRDKRSNRADYHIFRIQGESAKRLASLVWNEDLNCRYNRSSVWRDDDYLYVPIMSIKEIKNNLPVYNLTVEGTHTYLVNGGIATCNSAVAGLQALVERLRSLREKIEQSYIYPKFMNPLALVHGFRDRRAADLDHRVRTSSRHGGSDLIVPDIRWRKSLDPVQDQTLLATWQALHEKGILSDRTYAIGSGLNIDIERKNLQEEAKWKASFAAEFGAGAEGEEAGGIGGLGMGAPLPGGEPMPEEAPTEAPEGGGGETRGSSLRTANGGVRVRPDDVAAVRSILRGEDPDHPDWTGYLERTQDNGYDLNDIDALDEHLVSLGLTDAEITEVLRQAGLRRMPIRIGSNERNRRGFDKALGDLSKVSEGGSKLLSGI